MQVKDAYGDDAFGGELAVGLSLRRRVVSTNEASRARARDILAASRIEDVDHGYGVLEEVGEEEI